MIILEIIIFSMLIILDIMERKGGLEILLNCDK